jgi:hypothetical protein
VTDLTKDNPELTDELRAAADEANGIVVKRLATDEIAVVDRHEILAPATAQRVLYVSPLPEPDDGDAAVQPD